MSPRPQSRPPRSWPALIAASLAFAAPAGCSQNGSSSDSNGASSADAWPADLPPLEFARRTPATGPPEAFILKVGTGPTAEEFIARYARPLWGLGPADELRAGHWSDEPNNVASASYRQFHAGYPVEDGTFTLTTRRGRVAACGGAPVGGLAKLDVQVRVTRERAVQIARERAAAALGKHESELELQVTPDSRLVIIAEPRTLAWNVLVDTVNPFAGRGVSVDAATGEVLRDVDTAPH